MSLVPRSFFLDDFFDDFGKVKVQDMKCDIYEENNSYVVEMDVPGFNKDEIDIDVTMNNPYTLYYNEYGKVKANIIVKIGDINYNDNVEIN